MAHGMSAICQVFLHLSLSFSQMQMYTFPSDSPLAEGSLSLAYYRHWVAMGLSSRQGQSACHVSLKDHLSQCGVQRMHAYWPTLLWCSQGRWLQCPPEMTAGLPVSDKATVSFVPVILTFHSVSDWTNVITNFSKFSDCVQLWYVQHFNWTNVAVFIKEIKKASDLKPYRSRVEVFFLLSFLLWVYHLKKIHCCQLKQQLTNQFIHQFNLSFVLSVCFKESTLSFLFLRAKFLLLYRSTSNTCTYTENNPSNIKHLLHANYNGSECSAKARILQVVRRNGSWHTSKFSGVRLSLSFSSSSNTHHLSIVKCMSFELNKSS